MNYRDIIAEEMGMIPCPLSHESYTTCDGDCDNCEIYIQFVHNMEGE